MKLIRARWHNDITQKQNDVYKEEQNIWNHMMDLLEEVKRNTAKIHAYAYEESEKNGYTFIEILKEYEEIILREYSLISQYLAKKGWALCLFEDTSMKNYQHNLLVLSPDQIRLSTIELFANEVYERNIEGNVAELGVYKGDTSMVINQLFPDRKLYLFDTFEGLAEQDIVYDRNSGLTQAEAGCMGDTSVELVLNKMKYRDKCIIRKGYFPTTAEGLEEKFCFVNIDCDLYLPIYEGLKYFYERLVPGGCILVHDYLADFYGGAKKAVRQFSEEYKVNYIVLPDAGTSAVFIKSHIY